MLRDPRYVFPEGTVRGSAVPIVLGDTVRSYFIIRGATAQVAEVLARELGDTTFEGYNGAWNRLVPAFLQACLADDPIDFMRWGRISFFKLAVVVASLTR